MMSDKKLIIKLPVSNEDFLVEVDKCVFLFSAEHTEHADIDEDGVTTWYFPYSGGSYELRIVSQAVADSTGAPNTSPFQVLLMADGQSFSASVIYKQVIFEDIFPIIIKTVDDDWQETSTTEPQGDSPSLAVEEVSTPASDLQIGSFNLKSIKKLPRVFYIAVAFILLVSGILILNKILIPTQASQGRNIKELGSKLAGTTSPLIYLVGKDDGIIVLVQNQRESDWVKQRLQQEQLPYSVTVKKQTSQEVELEKILLDEIPNLLKINLSVPCEPQIAILDIDGDMLPKKELFSFVQKTFSEYFSCEKLNINFRHYKPEKLLSDAKLGIALSNLPWIIQGDKKSPIFIIDAQLNDHQTITAVNFIEDFRKNFGTNYIKFSLSLSQNSLLGRSFLNNRNGYVLLDRNHWYFNNTVE